MIVNLNDDKRFFVVSDCSQTEYDQLKFAYTKKVDGYRHNPLFKKKLWDGNISFIQGASPIKSPPSSYFLRMPLS